MQPFNFVTMTEYAGKNAIELAVNEYPAYATFNQIRANGGKVKKGAKGYHIFCGFRDKLDPLTGKTVSTPRGAIVFHIEDCDLDPDYLTEIAAQAATGGVAPSDTRINNELVASILA